MSVEKTEKFTLSMLYSQQFSSFLQIRDLIQDKDHNWVQFGLSKEFSSKYKIKKKERKTRPLRKCVVWQCQYKRENKYEDKYLA